MFGKPAESSDGSSGESGEREAHARGPEAESKPNPHSGRHGRHQHRLNVLGLPRDATLLDIKSRYRRLVKECHPDLLHQKNELERRQAERRFVEITCAYQELVEHW